MRKKFKFITQKQNNKVNIFNTDTNILNTDLLSGPHIEMIADREIIIEGCCGVLEYNENYIRLNLQKGSLVLCGSNFDISLFENRQINITGKITSVEFCF